MGQGRATSLLRHSERWDSDPTYRAEKAALGWVRHDACTVLHLPGEIQADGQPGPAQALSWFPRHIADDPFVCRLGLRNRVARMIRLMGIVLSQNEAYETHSWYTDGLSLYCAQSVADVRLALRLTGGLPDSWRDLRQQTRIFWSLGGVAPSQELGSCLSATREIRSLK